MEKNEKIKEVLSRGVEEILVKKELEKKLRSKKRLRIKLGIDPTSPNIHIGRSIPLLKIRDFQELGHKIVFIIGDFTGVIGDTSDKDSERPMLSEKEVERNFKTYVSQIKKIIDIDKCEIRYNGEWLSKLGYHEIGRQADVFSLNEFISRENIKKRTDEGKRVSLREVLYPLMQGYDSVAVRADVEVGGTDQRFNLLAGRQLQRYYGQPPQDIITNPLIEGLDGRKMSSSWGNTINLTDPPEEMYGKIMSLRDDLIIRYFTLVTRVDMAKVKRYQKELDFRKNPRDYKMKLAFELVRFYFSEKEAKDAEAGFARVFREKKAPLNISEVRISGNKMDLVELVNKTGLVKSKGEARRLILQGGVRINDKKKTNSDEVVNVKKGMIIQIGKRKFVKIGCKLS